MLTLAVIAIFCAMVAAVAWASSREERPLRPVRVRHDDESRYHRRNLPGSGD